jgi:hypothetical protein
VGIRADIGILLEILIYRSNRKYINLFMFLNGQKGENTKVIIKYSQVATMLNDKNDLVKQRL